MAKLDDRLLRAKVALIKKTSGAKAAAKNALTINAVRNTESKNAAEIANRVKPPIEQFILDTIDRINRAAESGEFHIIVELTPANRSTLIKYFKGKNYVLITSRNLNILVISWLGGKKWRKYNLGTEAIRATTKDRVADAYESLLNSEWTKSDRKTKSDWEWINPSFGKKTIDKDKLLQLSNKS